MTKSSLHDFVCLRYHVESLYSWPQKYCSVFIRSMQQCIKLTVRKANSSRDSSLLTSDDEEGH